MGEYLNLNFTAEEALKTATLVNFINKAFVGNGASNWYHPGTHNWNLGTFTDDLEFTVKGMHFDATLMTKKQMQKFASIFASAGNIQIFADWLNSMKKWA